MSEPTNSGLEHWQPPLPPSYEGRGRWLRKWRLARENILMALPQRLFRAWMAEARTPLFHSFVVNQPDLVQSILTKRADAFPKHPLYRRALGDLLGDSVFASRPNDWVRHRPLVDRALTESCPANSIRSMNLACDAMIARLRRTRGAVEVEREASFAAADVIMRALFSKSIDAAAAREIFNAFRSYQATAPMLGMREHLLFGGSLARFGRRRRARRSHAQTIRRHLTTVIETRQRQIAFGTAPDDVATALMTAVDPETGNPLSREEIVDQMAILFMAGHETSAAALSWALFLVAGRPDVQARLRDESGAVFGPEPPGPCALGKLHLARDVIREALRLYPPVPMFLRRASRKTQMRDRMVPRGSVVVISPWHLGRHERIWDNPHEFDPDRWRSARARRSSRGGFLPFSAGPRACPGAGFAMQEGVLFLSRLIHDFDVSHGSHTLPQPVAQLTTRSKDGIWLLLQPRSAVVAQRIQDEETNG